MNMTQDAASATKKQVLMMGTCLCDAFYADAAKATVQVLEHLGVEVIYPEDQTCCGQPAFNAGDWKSSRKVARHAMEVFQGDLPIIIPSGSCAAMQQHGNPLQFENEEDLPEIEAMGRRTFELADYIVHELGITTWPGSFNAHIAFHHSCHTRGTGTREAATTLLNSIEGIQLVEYGQKEQCCGFGGTFCVTFPNISGKMGTLKLDHLLDNQPDYLVSADLSCMMHLGGLAEKQGRPIEYRHIAQILLASLKGVDVA
ncbi:(Fe-S)-binding protein [Verrucomicrobiaceae bacterium N1E253]|uniref:(Fe-S)-binding protein n=1 Tax=Oceaniferula marina TaxID=2748318 RepID=A0A851GHI2_9BACT|nr:(Fe-S)-binding protein [Oceaniferula marina]NWK56659.1 (Fe-S)-binding protein [Oceaniferula marina]